MTLATRCPACGTVFRVVQDQLRVSEGWVRCGRCADVFNAAERLVDLESEDSIAVGSGRAHRDRVIDDLARVAGQAGPGADATPATPRPPEPATLPTAPGLLDSTAPSAPPAAGRPGEEPAWAENDSALDDSRPAAEPADLRAGPTRPPSFVRRADRAAHWRQPRLRAALAGLALVAGGGLALQIAVEYRDLIAARWSATRPALEQLCQRFGCRVEPPRLIDGLVVESSGLVRVDQTDLYRLSLVLRNRVAIELAAPAIDLSLTDAQGRVITRRVLGTADLGVPQRSLAAGGELPIKAVLAVGDRTVTGYTIEVFYP